MDGNVQEKEAKKIQFILTNKQLLRFSELYGLDYPALEAINALGLLNYEYIRDLLIREDFHQLTKGIRYIETAKKSYSYKELKKALAIAYRLPLATIDNIIQAKANPVTMYFCKQCGKRITPFQAKRTGGICSDCMVENLGL